MEPKKIGITDSIKFPEIKVGFETINIGFKESLEIAFSSFSEKMRGLSEQIASIEFPKIVIPEFPKFEFPNFPKLDWDTLFDGLTDECKSNTSFGWCLSAEMPLVTYREIARTEEIQEVRDALFVKEFEDDDFYLYNNEKEYIMSSNNAGWKEFYEECFFSVENHKYKVAIPSLVSAIEHELDTNLANSIGRRLISDFHQYVKDNNVESGINYTIGVSIISFLENSLFKRHEFNQDRSPLLNRNWVLHGRDNPSFWGKTDVYKLMTIISALKMIKE